MAAKKDKHPGGRPLLFGSVEELEAKIKEYFEWCDNGFRTEHDPETGQEKKVVSWPHPYTVSGLASWLGTSRQTLINYEERDQFFDTIKNAKAKIEADNEERAIISRNPGGVIFVLKNNFRWVDESKQTIDGNLKTSQELSPEAAAVLAKASRAKDGTTKSD